MAFSLPALPFAVEALEPHIDALTMTIHHTKHHQAYINNVNAALDKYPEFKDVGIVGLQQLVGSEKLPQDIATTVRNNGGGHWNHSFFWTVLAPPGQSNGPSASLKEVIDRAFGSLDEMRNKFNAAAASRFGSGWAWLILKKDGSLAITSSPNQDNPLQTAITEVSGIPILGLDVWEHAYYLKYQNRRPEYINAFWSVVNWEQVNANYENATRGLAFLQPAAARF